jgi:hypothetical protein
MSDLNLYNLQAGTYAFAVEQVTGRRVKEVAMVFLTSAGEYLKSILTVLHSKVVSA